MNLEDVACLSPSNSVHTPNRHTNRECRATRRERAFAHAAEAAIELSLWMCLVLVASSRLPSIVSVRNAGESGRPLRRNIRRFVQHRLSAFAQQRVPLDECFDD